MDKVSLLQKLGKEFLNILFPEGIKCIFCGCDLPNPTAKCTCEECELILPFNIHNKCLKCDDHIHSMALFCDRCQNFPPHFKKARACFVYDRPVSSKIHALKYSNAKYLVPPLVAYLEDCYLANNYDADVIIPVPLHPARLKERGYNQAELLAINLGARLNIPVEINAVERIKETHTQTKLDYEKRRENIDSAFKVTNYRLLKGKSVLLIDDVLTSGATMNECARTVKKFANKVLGLVIARTVIKK